MLFTSLAKIIRKCFFFCALINGIILLICFLGFSLKVYRNKTGFYVLILHPATFLTLLLALITWHSVLFSVQSIMPSVKRVVLFLTFQFYTFYLSFQFNYSSQNFWYIVILQWQKQTALSCSTSKEKAFSFHH